MLEVLFLLLISHAVCDYALQSDFIAQAKNRHTAIGKQMWQFVLPAHGLIHAGGVYVVTNSIGASVFQLITHVIIDYMKCDDRISFNVDQLMHIVVMGVIAVAVA